MIDETKSWIESKLQDNGLSRIQTTDDDEFGRSFLRPPSALYAVKLGNVGRNSGDGDMVRIDLQTLIIIVGDGQQDCTNHFIKMYNDMINGWIDFTDDAYTMEGVWSPVSPQEPEVVSTGRREYALAMEFTATVIYTKP